MSQPVLLKVYGNLHPADAADFEALSRASASCVGEGAEPPVTLAGDRLRISFEGLYFPVDEVLEALAALLKPRQQGKLDVLDLDAWRLTRHLFQDGRITSRSAPLNNVLDFSGH